MHALLTENMTRLYRNGRGVKQINLAVERGEVFGFLGPNGAGKTTLIRTVLGFLKPDSGRIHVLGKDAVTQSREVRRQIGYLPSDPALYDLLTGRQNIQFSLAVRGIRNGNRAEELARRLEIDLDRRIKTLSRGNKQKVAIVAALAHDPELLILDEPTSGLDPLVQETFRDLILQEQARGRTIFMSSHVLSEVEQLCDRVGVIRDGQMVAVGPVEQLKQKRVKYVAVEFAGAAPDLAGVTGVEALQSDGRRARFTLNGSLDGLVAELARHSLTDLSLTDPPLEEIFRAYYEGGAAQ